MIRQSRFVLQTGNIGIVLHRDPRPFAQIRVYRTYPPRERFKARIHVARKRFDTRIDRLDTSA